MRALVEHAVAVIIVLLFVLAWAAIARADVVCFASSGHDEVRVTLGGTVAPIVTGPWQASPGRWCVDIDAGWSIETRHGSTWLEAGNAPGRCIPDTPAARADVDGDGFVLGSDFTLLIKSFGQEVSP